MALGLSAAVSAAEVSITLREKPALVFSGEKQVVPLIVKNGGEDHKASLEYRVFQLATGVAAPVGQQTKWKEIPLHAGQSVLESFSLSLPEVKSRTSFAIKFFEDSASVGSVVIEAFQPNLLSQLKETFAEHQLLVFDENDRFAPALAKAGIEFSRIKGLDSPILTEKPAIIFAGGFVSPELISDLSKAAVGIIHLQKGGRELDRLPIEGEMKNRAFVVSIEPTLLADFASSPAAQINFLRAAQYALRKRKHSDINE